MNNIQLLIDELKAIDSDETNSPLCTEFFKDGVCTGCPVAGYVGIHNYCSTLTQLQYTLLITETLNVLNGKVGKTLHQDGNSVYVGAKLVGYINDN